MCHRLVTLAAERQHVLRRDAAHVRRSMTRTRDAFVWFLTAPLLHNRRLQQCDSLISHRNLHNFKQAPFHTGRVSRCVTTNTAHARPTRTRRVQRAAAPQRTISIAVFQGPRIGTRELIVPVTTVNKHLERCEWAPSLSTVGTQGSSSYFQTSPQYAISPFTSPVIDSGRRQLVMSFA